MSHIHTAADRAAGGGSVLVVTDTRAQLESIVTAIAAEVPGSKTKHRRESVEASVGAGTVVGVLREDIEVFARGRKADLVLIAPRFVQLDYVVVQAVAWLTATAEDPTVLLHNP